jgi:hypothetical protein
MLMALAAGLSVTMPPLKHSIPHFLPDSRERNTGAAKQKRAAKRGKKK